MCILFLLTNIVVFIVDNTDLIDTIKKAIWKKFIKTGDYHNLILKPFECSLCMTFWTLLIYLLCAHTFTIPAIAFSCLLAFLTPQVKELQNFVADFVQHFLNILYSLFVDRPKKN